MSNVLKVKSAGQRVRYQVSKITFDENDLNSFKRTYNQIKLAIKKEDISLMAKHAEKEANPLYPVPKLMNKQELANMYYKIGGIEK